MDETSTKTSNLPTIVFFISLAIIATLTALNYFIENSRVVRLARRLPNPPHIPILGHALLFAGISPEAMVPIALKLHKSYGTVASIQFGTRVLIYLSDPKDVEIILGGSVHLEKSAEYRYFQPWLGDGLLVSKGDKWIRHRKIIAPTFHKNILKTFVPLFYENSMDLVRRLRDEVGKEFDCHNYLSALSVDILTETAMGVRGKKRQNSGYDYAAAVMKMTDILHRRHYDFSLHSDIIFKFTKFAKAQEKLLKIIHTLADGIIKEKSEECEEKHIKDQQQTEVKPIENLTATGNKENDQNNSIKYTKLHYVRDDLDDIDESDVGNKKQLAFLDMMFDLKKNGEQMTDEEIRDEVNNIMFEGHDTTAAGSSFALCILGYHRDIQTRVHEELDEIFGDSDRQCTFEDTLEMKYLERVILETLRLFPPVPVIARKLNEDVQIGDYTLPKTATVMIPPFAIHRMEKYYPNSTVFNPDNFLPEKMQERHYYAFIPFSAGPRSCVGRKYAMLKLKVLLSTILRNYRVTSDVADQDFILRGDIILKKHDGFKIKIEPRKPTSRT